MCLCMCFSFVFLYYVNLNNLPFKIQMPILFNFIVNLYVYGPILTSLIFFKIMRFDGKQMGNFAISSEVKRYKTRIIHINMHIN